MAQRLLSEAKGLHTDPSYISNTPEGALTVAENVVIDKEGTIQPQRGFRQYSEPITTSSGNIEKIKQLLFYKDKILYNVGDNLKYNSEILDIDGHDMTGQVVSVESPEDNIRIKGLEANGNLYYTTNNAINKVYNHGTYLTNSPAGAPHMGDVSVRLIPNPEREGFLPNDSKVAYRCLWGFRDSANNLILGAPSERVVVTNAYGYNVNVELTIPSTRGWGDFEYFIQIYRTPVVTATLAVPLSDVQPGNDYNLVNEEQVILSNSVRSYEMVDKNTETFRAQGAFLYTSENSGQGASQINTSPPQATDLTYFQGNTLYSNTTELSSVNLTFLGTDDLVSGTSKLIITDNSSEQTHTYTFEGVKHKNTLSYAFYTDTIPDDIAGEHITLYSANDERKYYLWYDAANYEQEVDFSGFTPGTIPNDFYGSWIIWETPTGVFATWFDTNGANDEADDITDTNNDLDGIDLYQVNISSSTTKANVLNALVTTLTNIGFATSGIHTVNYDATDETVNIITDSFDHEERTVYQTVDSGVTVTATAADIEDPGLESTDGSFEIGIRVPVVYGVDSKQKLAQETASALKEFDEANFNDFTTTHSGSGVIIECNRNGKSSGIDTSTAPGVFNSITTIGKGENIGARTVLISDAETPSLRIEETARSIVNVINGSRTNNYQAFYVSGLNDLPGKIQIRGKNTAVKSLSFKVDSTNTTGKRFFPNLTTTNTEYQLVENHMNRIFWSKIQQPDAVPPGNYFDVGSMDQPIHRIIPLRESLFVLKGDGIYRVTGENGVYQVTLFDNTTKIIAPDSAVTVNNLIFCLTNQGVVSISDVGVEILSKPIDNLINDLTKDEFHFYDSAFGVSYETDRAYFLFLQANPLDNSATMAFRYNIFTKTWTTSLRSVNCGGVNPANNKLYFGEATRGVVLEERKEYDKKDFADVEIMTEIGEGEYQEGVLTLAGVDVSVGDSVTQKQYLTEFQFNKLLKIIDINIDSDVDISFLNELEAIDGDALDDKLTTLANELDDNSTLVDTDYGDLVTKNSFDAVTGDHTTLAGSTTIIQTHHGLVSGRVIRVFPFGYSPVFHSITRINEHSFSIPVAYTANEITWSAELDNSQELQAVYNLIVEKLSDEDPFENVTIPESIGVKEYESLISEIKEDKENNTFEMTLELDIPLTEGKIVIYPSIKAKIVYAPDSFGDPSIRKQVQESSFIYDELSFSNVRVSFQTDSSPGLELVDFKVGRNHIWGEFAWGQRIFGGGDTGIPLRTYVPREKQRCQRIWAQVEHNTARQAWALFGMSYTFRGISQKTGGE